MALTEQFKTDENLETKGIVIDYGTTRIRVARAGGSNKHYAKAMSRRTKAHRRAIALQILPPEQANEILQSVFAETVVLDWQEKVDGAWVPGINPEDAGEKGKDLLAVNTENILKVFRNLPDLFVDLQQQAQAAALFQAAANEEAAGN